MELGKISLDEFGVGFARYSACTEGERRQSHKHQHHGKDRELIHIATRDHHSVTDVII